MATAADDRVAGGPGWRPATFSTQARHHFSHCSVTTHVVTLHTLIGRDCDARILLVVLRPGLVFGIAGPSQAATRAEALAAIERNARGAHSDAVLVMHDRETLLELKPAAGARSPRAD